MKTHQKKGRETSNMFPPFFFSHSVIHKRKHFSLFSRSHTSISQTHAENHPNNVNLFVDTEIPETTTVGARPSRLALAPERIPLSWLTRELENEREREKKPLFFGNVKRDGRQLTILENKEEIMKNQNLLTRPTFGGPYCWFLQLGTECREKKGSSRKRLVCCNRAPVGKLFTTSSDTRDTYTQKKKLVES